MDSTIVAIAIWLVCIAITSAIILMFWHWVLPIWAIGVLVYVCWKSRNLNTTPKKAYAIIGALLGLGGVCALVCAWHWVLLVVVILSVIGYFFVIEPLEERIEERRKEAEEARWLAEEEAEEARRLAEEAEARRAAEESKRAKWKQEEEEWAEWKSDIADWIDSWFANADVILDTNVWMELEKEYNWIFWMPKPEISEDDMPNLEPGKVDMSVMMPTVRVERDTGPWRDIDGVSKYGRRRYEKGRYAYWEVYEWSYQKLWEKRVKANPGSTLLEVLSWAACSDAKVVVPGALVDELEKITHKDPDAKKRKAAARAKERIERLQERGQVVMPGVTDTTDWRAYLDAILIKTARARNEQGANNSKSLKIVSFDRGLRMKLRGVNDKGAVEVYAREDLINLLNIE